MLKYAGEYCDACQEQWHGSEVLHRAANSKLHDSDKRHFAAANSWIVPSCSYIAE